MSFLPRRVGFWVRGRLLQFMVALACLGGAPVRADLFETYRPARQFDLPPGTAAFDALADGRLIALVDDEVYVEVAPDSATFSLSGSLPAADIPSFGAAFLRVSPNGQRIAVGNNGGAFGDNYAVGVFDVGTLTGDWFLANHLDAEWYDNIRLAITAGDFVNPSILTILNADSPDPQNPSNITVIDNIGGASGGVAFDAAGNLYTGNGFEFAGPSGTGAVKAFALSEWLPILSGGSPLDFENDGILIVDVLSASPIGLDAEGNLLVGGGDFSSNEQSDFVALVRGSAVTAALLGSGPVDTADPAQMRRLDPIPGNDFNFFVTDSNDALQELYVRDFGGGAVYVYQDAPPIPAVSTWGIVIMLLVISTVGTLVLVRSRSARTTPAGTEG